MVVCSRFLKMVLISFLPLHRPAQVEFRQLKKLFVVTPREEVNIFWLQLGEDEVEDGVSFVSVAGRNSG